MGIDGNEEGQQFEEGSFEDPEDGGDVDMEAEQIYALLQKMSARLGYLPGMHDVCFAVAVVEQYKLAKDPMQLELLESTVRSKLATPFDPNMLLE